MHFYLCPNFIIIFFFILLYIPIIKPCEREVRINNDSYVNKEVIKIHQHIYGNNACINILQSLSVMELLNEEIYWECLDAVRYVHLGLFAWYAWDDAH